MSDISVGSVGSFEPQAYEQPSAPPEETVSDEALVQANTSENVAEIAITNDEVQQAFDSIYEEETEAQAQESSPEPVVFDHGDGTYESYTNNHDGSQNIVKRFYNEEGVLMESRIYVTPDGDYQNVGYQPVNT